MLTLRFTDKELHTLIINKITCDACASKNKRLWQVCGFFYTVGIKSTSASRLFIKRQQKSEQQMINGYSRILRIRMAALHRIVEYGDVQDCLFLSGNLSCNVLYCAYSVIRKTFQLL